MKEHQRLGDDFLAPYYKKGDNFPNLLARSTYLSKYSRGGESWTDTIRRTVDGNCDLADSTTMEERERLFHAFWTMQALPPGRGLWVGGIEGIPADARYNCMKGETRFFADGRLAALKDLIGQTVQVRCVDGEWRPAEVKNFGKQKLFTYVLRGPGRSKFELVYEATENHRWITDNRGTIDDLRVGDTVRVTPDPINLDSEDFKAGFVHGVVFGDGSAVVENNYTVRLCWKKNEILDTLKASKMYRTHSTPPSYGGDVSVRLVNGAANMKAVPVDDTSFDYQAGFLAGWLYTDGSLRAIGSGGNRLSSIDHAALGWVIDRAPFLGYCVTGDIIDSTTETNYGKRNGQIRVLTLTTESVLYAVRQKIDEGKEEDVYCVTEPVTHTFTIEGGVRTGQCWYTTVYDYKDWGWIANQLMLGGGVGVGLSGIADLPVVARDDQAIFQVFCNPDHPNHGDVKPDYSSFDRYIPNFSSVADSREGWVSSLTDTLGAAFSGKSLFRDVTAVRPRGQPIKTFGGTACGPGPLVELLRSVWKIVRGAQGRRLTSVEALDITNYVGKCIKAGNVRRSALIALGQPSDQDFRDAKKDWDAVLSHRHTSNNSIAFTDFNQFDDFNWKGLAMDNIEFGEPGILNLALGRRTDPGAMGVNPCLTGDTRIATQFGLVRIDELARMKTPLRVTTDARVASNYEVTGPLGTEVRDAQPAFKASEAEEVFCVTTTAGYSVRATSYHKFPTQDGFVELHDLRVGDSLLLQSAEGQWGRDGSEDLGTIIGFIEGDGNFHGEAEKVTLRFWGEQKHLADNILPACAKMAQTIPSANNRDYTMSVVHIEERDSAEITSERLAKALAEVGYRQKGAVPEVVWRGSRECVRGYLRGIFATDGQINWSKKKQCFSIRLSQSNPSLLGEVQVLLQNFGIVSSIYPRRDAGWRRMPDGKGGMKDYWCEEQFDLVISKVNAQDFAEKVGFLLDTHAAMYAAWHDTWKRGPYTENFTDVIASITYMGVEPVYCTTQDSHHTFVAAGIVTGNCGEQLLHDREACNLAEVFPANFDGSMETDTILKLVARYCLRQRLTPLLDDRSNEVGKKNMRVGVGLGGICDFDWTEDLLASWFRVVREACNDYADELGVSRPITTTTVKPSGTISLLCGSSPGLHAPYAEYYMRRTRHAVDDPMTQSLMGAGVPFELDQYDNTCRTLVFTFPMKAKHTRVTVQSETLREQFARQLSVQNSWADNAVSCTITFDKDKPDDLAACMREYVPQLKSTSCLPKAHGYAQAPYEAIDQEAFSRLSRGIDFSARLERGADFDVEECAGGVCPVK